MSHKRDIEAAIPNVLQSSKLVFEVGRDGIGARTVILGTEVEVVTVPFGVDVYNVVEASIFRRRLDVLRFENGFNEFLSLLLQVSFDTLRYFGFGSFGWTIDPSLLSFCHSFSFWFVVEISRRGCF